MGGECVVDLEDSNCVPGTQSYRTGLRVLRTQFAGFELNLVVIRRWGPDGE